MLPSCKVSPPDAHGYVSLGISVAIAMSVLRYAKTIVAEVNPFMPRTLGDTFLHVDRIDRFVRVERPLAEYTHQPADAVAERIARYVAEIIEDGAESLLDEAKRQSLVPAAHRLGGGRDYLVEEERVVTLKSGSKVMIRPAR
jgi:acyl-CoA hydrolase